MRIYVDELKNNGFNIYLGDELVETCFTEEGVHTALITLIDERLGESLMSYNRIIHTEIGESEKKIVSDISVAEYMEEEEDEVND